MQIKIQQDFITKNKQNKVMTRKLMLNKPKVMENFIFIYTLNI